MYLLPHAHACTHKHTHMHTHMHVHMHAHVRIHAHTHQVMKNPIVAYVEEDAHHSLGQTSGSTSSIEQNWALDSIDGNRDYIFHRPCNLTGIGVDVYIVDTGLQYNHTEFSGRAEFSGCDSVDMMSSSQLQGSDCDGHGTAVAGIVGGLTTGVANKVTLRSVRAIKCNQNTTNALLILAFDCLLNQTKTRGRPAIAQVSVYGVKSRSVKRSIDTLSNHGITVVTLSGNRDSSSKRKMNSCKVAPASYIGVISVAGLKDNYHAFEKNYMGQCVDIFAPGYKVHVPYLYNKLNCGYSTACYARASGGSFAAPFVSGALALLLEKCPNLPQWRIKYTLINKMAVPHRITMPSTHIPKKYRKLTPNLTLHLGNEMCTIICSPPW